MKNFFKKLKSNQRRYDSTLNGSELVFKIAESAINLKAVGIVALDLRGISDVADYYLIAGGNSSRHVKGIVDAIDMDLKKCGLLPSVISGYDTGDWVALDYGSVIAHIFERDARLNFDLEGLWHNARRISFEDPRHQTQAVTNPRTEDDTLASSLPVTQ